MRNVTSAEITAPGIYVIDLGRAGLNPKNFRRAVAAIKVINEPWQGYREDGSYGRTEPDGSAEFDPAAKIWTVTANGERTVERLRSISADFVWVKRA